MTSETAAGRAYSLLAAAFRHPRPELFEVLRGGGFSAELALALGELGLGDLPEVGEAARAAAQMTGSFEMFEADYIQALDLSDAKRGASPYAASYVSAPPAEVLLDLKGRYAAFGLGIGPAERPDHASAELEFLAYLAGRHDDPDHGPAAREAERDFLSTHVKAWFPSFSERLAARPGMEVHAKLAAIAGKLAASRAEALADDAKG